MGLWRSRVWGRAAVWGGFAAFAVAVARRPVGAARGRRISAHGVRHLSLDAAIVAVRLGPGSPSVRRTSAAARPTSRSPTAAIARRIYAGVRHERRLEDRRQRRDVAGDLRAPGRRPASATSRSRPSNPDIVWVGTGEANLFRASMAGVGVYKSTDGGRTFAHAGPHRHADDRAHRRPPGEPRHRLRRRLRPRVDRQRDARRVQDDRRRPHVEEGALPQPADRRDRSRDGSRRSRTRSTPRCGSASAGSGAIRASSPATPKAASGRRPTAGNSWTEANDGLPAAQYRGRIGIDIARSNPNVLYAFVDNYEPGARRATGERDAYQRPILEARIKAAEIYRTDDKGAAWRKVSESNDFMSGHSGTYGWVFGQIRVDPTDENTIYTLGLGLNVSRDGGKTFTALRGMHGDHHGLWIDPANPAILYNANDGGILRRRTRARRGSLPSPPAAPVLQRHARQQLARPGPTDRFRTSAAGGAWSISAPGRDRIPAVEWTSRARRRRARITPSIRTTRTSSTRTASTATSRARI